jgi:multidrug efflux pump
MAVAIMGGLMVATALTLLFLPALYAAWFRVKKPAKRPPGRTGSPPTHSEHPPESALAP